MSFSHGGWGSILSEVYARKVSLPVVRRFVQYVSDQAVGTGVIRGVKPDQQLVKIVHDELVKLMGGEVSELQFAKSGPTVILLARLQGVGKTTVCAKLACYLKKQGKSCMLIVGDVYRPAAIDQLVILGEQVSVPVYTAGTDVKPSDIAKQGLKEAKKNNVDVVIMDTAGRLQIDKGMMDELKDVKKVLNPTEVLLVVDAMTGQEAADPFRIRFGLKAQGSKLVAAEILRVVREAEWRPSLHWKSMPTEFSENSPYDLVSADGEQTVNSSGWTYF